MNAVKSANYTKGKVRELQRTLYLAARANANRRFHALYDKVYRSDVMWEAWKRVKANRGSAGVDGMTIQHIVQEYGEEQFVKDTQQQLQENAYRPKPVRRKDIPKGDGKTRPLGILFWNLNDMVEGLNQKIRGLRNYYGITLMAKKWLNRIDWYILERLNLFWNKKKNKRHKHARIGEIQRITKGVLLKLTG